MIAIPYFIYKENGEGGFSVSLSLDFQGHETSLIGFTYKLSNHYTSIIFRKCIN